MLKDNINKIDLQQGVYNTGEGVGTGGTEGQ